MGPPLRVPTPAHCSGIVVGVIVGANVVVGVVVLYTKGQIAGRELQAISPDYISWISSLCILLDKGGGARPLFAVESVVGNLSRTSLISK